MDFSTHHLFASMNMLASGASRHQQRAYSSAAIHHTIILIVTASFIV